MFNLKIIKMVKFLLLINLFVLLFITKASTLIFNNRNPFSYGITDQFKFKAIGKIENTNNICALITINNKRFQLRINDFFCEKYTVIEISDQQILIKDIFDNQYSLKIDL